MKRPAPIRPGNIYLVGLRGSGKTSLGERVAAATGTCFVDQDAVVSERAGKPISRIFKEDGEAAFRRLEAEVLRELAACDGLVVATGGGVVLAKENRLLMRKKGKAAKPPFVIYLHAAPEVLAPRLQNDPASKEQRPPLTSAPDALAELRLLYQQRDRLYREVADVVVDASGSLDSEVAAVLAALSHSG